MSDIQLDSVVTGEISSDRSTSPSDLEDKRINYPEFEDKDNDINSMRPTFMFLGITALLYYNVVICSYDFFSALFPSGDFFFYAPFGYSIAAFVAVTVLLFVKVDIYKKIYIAIAIFLFSFIIMPFSVYCSPLWAAIISYGAFCISGAANGLLFSSAVTLGSQIEATGSPDVRGTLSQAVMLGNGLIGMLSNVARALTKVIFWLITSDDAIPSDNAVLAHTVVGSGAVETARNLSTFTFFLISAVIVVICWRKVKTLPKMNDQTKTTDGDSDVTKHLDLEREEAGEGEGEGQCHSLFTVLKIIPDHVFTVFFYFAITYCLYPAIIGSFPSPFKDPSGWWYLCLTTTFSLSNYLARSTPRRYPSLVKLKPRVQTMYTLIRVVLVPIGIIFAFPSDDPRVNAGWLALVFVAVLGASQGVGITTSLMSFARFVPNAEMTDTASLLMSLGINGGLLVGGGLVSIIKLVVNES
eukprot:gnl/Dysnectes_brevis/4393_a5883_704.p1 GENE.gnl/Dysnectes_brevis/4393_a5883_704~~gnl/Dysnectes_brevis/4393_a5883_704.p1  ORF type:complete len:468 (+),score=50.75 gnl/Dysnectes_brevis/4393_a5883_704:41-1444(+)